MSALKPHCHHGDTVDNGVGLGVWACGGDGWVDGGGIGGGCSSSTYECYVKSLAHILTQDGSREWAFGGF